MNLAKFQDTKLIHRYLLHFYILTTKDHKEKLRKHPTYYHIKKNKISRKSPRIARAILRVKKKNRRHSSSSLVQSYSNQNSEVLANKQTSGSTELNREPQNKSIHLVNYSLTMEARI